MKYRIAITFTALLCSMAIATVWMRGETDADSYQTLDDITVSCVHSDTLLIPVRAEEVAEETVALKFQSGTGAEYYEPTEWILSRETIINTAYELYGVSEE